jgi:hypothetical protein
VEIRDRLAVGVVVHRDAQLAQTLGRPVGDLGRPGQRPPLVRQAVAEGGGDGPGPEATVQVPIDQDAGADVRAQIDVRFELRVLRNVAREVVIEVANLDSLFQQGHQPHPVHVQRDVEGGAMVARPRLDPAQEGDVALDAGDQRRASLVRGRARQPELLQGTEAISITVECVGAGHDRSRSLTPRRRSLSPAGRRQ